MLTSTMLSPLFNPKRDNEAQPNSPSSQDLTESFHCQFFFIPFLIRGYLIFHTSYSILSPAAISSPHIFNSHASSSACFPGIRMSLALQCVYTYSYQLAQLSR